MAETTEVEKGMSIFLDVFRRADKKDDGKISWEEFVSFFADGVMGKEELRTLFDEIDTHKTNYIDPKELCDYFATHLGPFKEILSLVEDLNTKVSNVLVSTSTSYPESSRQDQFVTRFLMGLVMSQVCALQQPLDSATEALEQQARDERTDIVAVNAEDVKEKKQESGIIPGRMVRRAKRQTSSQMSNEGGQGLGSTRAALEQQVDRLTSLLNRLENRVNFDGIVDEEVDVGEDTTVLLHELDVTVAGGQEQAFKQGLQAYIEATNAADGCLSETVRSFKDTNKFSMYEVWTDEQKKQSHDQSDVGKAFVTCMSTAADGNPATRSVVIPGCEILQEVNEKVGETVESASPRASSSSASPSSAVKSRKKYAVYLPADRADIGKYCAEHGPAATIRKFKTRFPELNESSARFMRGKYKDIVASRKRKSDFEEVTEIQSKKRGRPLMIGDDLDRKIQAYITVLRESGAVINSAIVTATAKGIILAIDKTLLSENGGSLSIGKDWAKSLMRRMNLVKRKGSTSCKADKVENFDHLKQEYLDGIQEVVSKYDIPAEMVINWDHAGLNIIPVSDWAVEEMGKKPVEISGLGDKRQITAVFAGTLKGNFLPPQIIFGGKTDRCHPSYKFPGDWDITHTENHCANRETQISYIDHVIVPYLSKTRKRLSLPETANALCIFDVFKAQMTDAFCDHLKKNHIKIVYIPACCTDKLQPMDLSVQKSVKSCLRTSFGSWYSEQITKQLSVGEDTGIVKPVQMPLHLMKELFSKWLVSMYSDIRQKPDLIIGGFRAAGITSVLEEIMPLNYLSGV